MEMDVEVESAVGEPIIAEDEKTLDQKVDEQIEKMMGNSRRGGATLMMQEVKLYPNHVEMEVKGLMKSISLVDFKNIIDAQLQTETTLTPMALPLNTMMFAKSGTEIQLMCYYPERKLDLKLQERGGYDTPRVKTYKGMQMPNIVISHILKLDNGFWLVTNSKYFATNMRPTELPEDRVLMEVPAEFRDRMWRVPLPNFYGDNRMCYGGNNMPVKYNTNLRGLDYFYQVLYESPFNYDLGINVPEYQSNIPGWFQHLTEVDKFPYEKLSQASNW